MLFRSNTMDDMSTPIDKLPQRNENPMENPMNPPEMSNPAPPVMPQYIPYHQMQQQQQPQQPKTPDNDYQKDIMYLTVICVLIYSSTVQGGLSKYIPTLFDDGRPTIVAAVINGILVGLLYILVRNLSINVKI